MTTSRHCRSCKGWHDLDEPWPEACYRQAACGGGLQVIRDIGAYKSMITGEMIDGRRQHRDHLKAHGCIEIGNEKMANAPPPPKTNRREVLHRQLADMSDRQANKILSQLKRGR